MPITLGIPFGIAPEILPTHVPLPAKIRTELLEPVHLDADPARADDRDYVEDVYHDIERRIQAGVDAARHAPPPTRLRLSEAAGGRSRTVTMLAIRPEGAA